MGGEKNTGAHRQTLKKRFSWNWFCSHEDGKKTTLLDRKADCFPGSLQSRSTSLLSWYSNGSIFLLPLLGCWLMPEGRAPSSVCQCSCSASPSQRRSGRQPLPSHSSQRTGLFLDKFSVTNVGIGTFSDACRWNYWAVQPSCYPERPNAWRGTTVWALTLCSQWEGRGAHFGLGFFSWASKSGRASLALRLLHIF